MIISQGHGKLNEIYAAVKEAASAKGWDGVDLVIICGDFQVSSDSVLQLFVVPNFLLGRP